MKSKVHYATVTEALKELHRQGFTIDFNLKENLLAFVTGKFKSGDFEIVDAYRYEGDTDPADESVVYAIESKNGIKGVLVTAYGSASDKETTELLKNLKTREN